MKLKNVSPLRPNLKHSNGITSLVPIFPRFTLAPNNLIKKTTKLYLILDLNMGKNLSYLMEKFLFLVIIQVQEM